MSSAQIDKKNKTVHPIENIYKIFQKGNYRMILRAQDSGKVHL